MPRTPALALIAVLLPGLCLPGCAWLGGRPGRLLDTAQQQLGARDAEAAYASLREIRLQHPESPEASEAFDLAARIVKRKYMENRFSAPDSPWVRSEPEFVFDWFGAECGTQPPEQAARALLLGMPYGYFRRFESRASESPELSACLGRWRIAPEEDNGIIEKVPVEPAA